MVRARANTGTVYSVAMPRDSPAIRAGTIGLAAAATIAAAGLVASSLGIFGRIDEPRRITYFVATGSASQGYQDSDRDLATWALRAWQNASRGRLLFEAVDESQAQIHIRWSTGDAGYGRTRRHQSGDGAVRATVFVAVDVAAMGPGIARVVREDPLMREVIVFLTCLHEIGHAIGRPHSDDAHDVMYDFALGGDVREYFLRYRGQVSTRGDLARVEWVGEL